MCSYGVALDHQVEGAAVDRLVVCVGQEQVLEALGGVLRVVPLHLHKGLGFTVGFRVCGEKADVWRSPCDCTPKARADIM